jgi:hypothetical protein
MTRHNGPHSTVDVEDLTAERGIEVQPVSVGKQSSAATVGLTGEDVERA